MLFNSTTSEATHFYSCPKGLVRKAIRYVKSGQPRHKNGPRIRDWRLHKVHTEKEAALNICQAQGGQNFLRTVLDVNSLHSLLLSLYLHYYSRGLRYTAARGQKLSRGEDTEARKEELFPSNCA